MLTSRLNYTKYYLLAITIIALITICGHSVLLFFTDVQQEQESAVRVSNQQQILSQRLAFYCLYLVGDSPDKDNEEIRDKIKELKRQMLRQHLGLQHGDPELALKELSDEALLRLFERAPNRLNDKIVPYFAAIDNLLSTPDSELRWDHPSLVFIADDAEDGYLLASLEQIKEGFMAKQRELSTFQRKLQWGSLLGVLLGLGVVARFVLYPMLDVVERRERLLKERNKKLLIMCKRMVKPKRKSASAEKPFAEEQEEPVLLLPRPKKRRLFYTSVPEYEE